MHSDSNVGVRWPTFFNCYFLRNKKPVLQSAEEEGKKEICTAQKNIPSCPYPQTVKRQQLVFTTELLKGFKSEFHHSCEKRPKWFTLDVPRIKNYRFLKKEKNRNDCSGWITRGKWKTSRGKNCMKYFLTITFPHSDNCMDKCHQNQGSVVNNVGARKLLAHSNHGGSAEFSFQHQKQRLCKR